MCSQIAADLKLLTISAEPNLNYLWAVLITHFVREYRVQLKYQKVQGQKRGYYSEPIKKFEQLPTKPVKLAK